MGNKLSRRDFIKRTALTGVGAVAMGGGLPLLISEKGMDFEENDSYWVLAQSASNPPLQEALNVDVAIVGGGYTGLSCAWHLAKNAPGLNVVILEARQVGHGASGRNGGMVLSQIGPESFEIAHDIETHKQTYDLTVAGMKSLQSLVQSIGVDCDLQLDGFVHAFLDEADWDYYEKYVNQVQQAGVPLKLLDEDEIAGYLGTNIYAGGVYDPHGGSVHAMKLVNALKMAVEGAGVRIFGDSPVNRIEEGERVRLLVGASNQVVRAKAVVLATNGYTSKLGYFKHQIMPIHVQTAVTPSLTPHQLDSIGWESHLPFYDSREALYHLVLTSDNRIAIGGGSAEYFFANDLRYRGNLSAISDMMLAELIHMYPALNGIRFEQVWNGILGMSFDSIPAAGVTSKQRNIFYGLGYSGQGINLSYVFGEVIAALIQGTHHPWLDTIYADYKFPFIPPEPYRWVGVQAAMKYYTRNE